MSKNAILVCIALSSSATGCNETRTDSATRVSEVQARFGVAPGRARFETTSETEVRAIAEDESTRGVKVTLPRTATGAVRLVAAASLLSIRFALDHVQDAPFETASGLVIYRRALGGADLIHRVHAEGTEDFVVFEKPPITEEIAYTIDVSRVAGLRLVSETLEFLDAEGSPQLRVAPPYVIDARGIRHAAHLALRDCAYDALPSPPWGRPVTSPGATQCSMSVAWRDVSYPLMVDPAWGATGSLTVARSGHTATVLPAGPVLFVGGGGQTAELYNAGTFAATGAPAASRVYHAAVALPSGKVLVSGGFGSDGFTTSSAETYDPTTGVFTPAAPMTAVRQEHTMSLLQNGKVLVSAGFDNRGGALASAELFDPAGNGALGTFTATGSLSVARTDHTATVLPSGQVLIVGGSNPPTQLASVELFDPATGTFTFDGSMDVARAGATATLLGSGKVLIAGGFDIAANAVYASAVIYDPKGGDFGTFAPAGSLLTARDDHTATLLPSGKVLIAGGFAGGSPTGIASAELYDPLTNVFTATVPMSTPRVGHTASLLASGKVLVAGGSNGLTLASAELFGGTLGDACSAGGTCLSGFCADGRCCDTACAGGGCDRCDLAGKEGTCTIAPSGNTGANPVCVAPLACDGVRSACPTSCDQDAACETTHYCAPDGSCQLRKAQGAPCDQAADCKQPGCRACATGFCTDGFCCDEACSGICQACAASLTGTSNGMCGPSKDGTDPRDQCAPSMTDKCAADGQCNGTGACRLAAPLGILCSDAKVCDGSGTCVVPTVPTCDGDHTTLQPDGTRQDCAPFKCDTNGTCKAKCASIDDCAAPAPCDPNGVCVGSDDPSSDVGGCSAAGASGTESYWMLGVLGWLAASSRRGLRRRRETEPPS